MELRAPGWVESEGGAETWRCEGCAPRNTVMRECVLSGHWRCAFFSPQYSTEWSKCGARGYLCVCAVARGALWGSPSLGTQLARHGASRSVGGATTRAGERLNKGRGFRMGRLPVHELF